MARGSFLEWVKRVGVALGWLLLFGALGVLLSVVLNSVTPVPSTSPWSLAANSGGQAVAFLLATWIVGRLLNKRSWDAMGWRARRAAGRLGGLSGWFGHGVALSVVLATVAIGLSQIGSRAAVQAGGDWARWLALAGPLALGFVAAALAEELVFRGYPLRRLAEALGPWAATLLLAALFGLVHLGNPDASALGTVNVALAALWLSCAFFSPGGMAYAWGLHFGWNAALAILFDAPVSGYRFQLPGVEYAPGRHAWVDGGAFGPEGGLVATLALLAGTALVVGRRLRRPATWLAA